MKIQHVEVCPDRRLHWTIGEEPAHCLDSSHVHRQVTVHEHLDQVTFPDGTMITAASFVHRAPYERDQDPDFALYLDPRWGPPWAHRHLEWPDFGVPDDSGLVVAALRSTLARARSGQRVEVGCLGAHGRTGTALACLAILTGVPAAEAVTWVRTAYCSGSVETAEQAAFVTGLAIPNGAASDR